MSCRMLKRPRRRGGGHLQPQRLLPPLLYICTLKTATCSAGLEAEALPYPLVLLILVRATARPGVPHSTIEHWQCCMMQILSSTLSQHLSQHLSHSLSHKVFERSGITQIHHLIRGFPYGLYGTLTDVLTQGLAQTFGQGIPRYLV